MPTHKITATLDGTSVSAALTVSVPPTLRVGVDNASNRAWINNNTIGKQLLAANVRWDRIDLGDGTNLTRFTDCRAMGFNALPMYNPGTGQSGGLNNKTAAQCASEVKALVAKLLPLGVTELEFGNEPWWNGDGASSYAAKYAAAHSAIAGTGVALIAAATGDWSPSAGVWSADRAGGGWIRDFVKALPTPGVSLVDGWSAHPYPPTAVLSVNNEDSGWPALAHWRTIAVSLGSSKPWYVTEVGMKVGQGGGQAQGLSEMFQSLLTVDAMIPGSPFDWVRFVAWYSATDDSSGTWGLFNGDGTPRDSFSALKAFVAANPGRLA